MGASPLGFSWDRDIASGAFIGCTALEHISIPPVALVVNTLDEGSNYLMRASMPKPSPLNRTVVVSKWMQYRSPSQLEQAEAKVNEILGRRQQTDEEKVASIREWFAYYDLLDVTTMLELAIWKANMNGTEQSAEARKASRRNSGSDMNVIIPGVLRLLEW